MLVMTSTHVLDQLHRATKLISIIIIDNILILFQKILLITYVEWWFCMQIQYSIAISIASALMFWCNVHRTSHRFTSLTFIFAWMRADRRKRCWVQVPYKMPWTISTVYHGGRMFARKRIRIGSPLCIQTGTHPSQAKVDYLNRMQRDSGGLSYLPRSYYQRVYFHLHLHFFLLLFRLVFSLV